MKVTKILIVLVAFLLPTGCFPELISSLNPIYTEDEIVFEPGILGTWKGEDFSWLFEERDGESYRLTEPDGDCGAFETRLCRIGNHLFMDLYPEKPHPGEDLFMIPTHTFVKITIEGDTMRVSFLMEEPEQGVLQTGKIKAPHVIVEGRPILTGSTRELRAMLLAHASDAEVFRTTAGLSRANEK